MGPKKVPVAILTPSTPTPSTPRAMRTKARSQSIQTDSASSTDPDPLPPTRKRARTIATTQPSETKKYAWPSFRSKMIKKLRPLHKEWSADRMKNEVSERWKKYKDDGSLGEGVDDLDTTDEEKVEEEKDDGDAGSE